MRAAKAWGLHPRAWREESVDDRALMLSFVLFESTLEARRQEYRDQKREREERRNGGDTETFSEMKRRLKREP